MTPFNFIAVVFIAAVAAIGVRYSSQRRNGTSNLEGTRRAVLGPPRNGRSIAGSGTGAG
jgi:hypothetical protein